MHGRVRISKLLLSPRRRGRPSRSGRSTWIVQGQPQWSQHQKPGISMVLVDSDTPYPVFKYVHSTAYQQFQFKFLEAVESLNPENIMVSQCLSCGVLSDRNSSL